MTDVIEHAVGRWPSILQALGVDKGFLTGRNGPCPRCGGTDRYRFTDHEGRGAWLCNQCCEPPGGDGFDLLQAIHGWDKARAFREVKAVVGISEPSKPKIRDDETKRRLREERNGIWRAARTDLSSVEGVRAWWLGRCGLVPSSPDLRASHELYHRDSRSRFPAMLALVRSPEGRPVQIHRTYVTETGAKAPVETSRMLMPKIEDGEMNGGAVRLARPDGRLGIAEGIETAVAATILTGIPCWAALNAGNLERWAPPPGQEITIFADNDVSYTGEAAAYALAKRLRHEGFQVTDQRPSIKGEDWNDVLLAMRAMGTPLPTIAANTNEHPETAVA